MYTAPWQANEPDATSQKALDKTMPFSVCALLVALTAALLWQKTVPRAVAQEIYPNRPVRMIVPFPAGGTADVLPRIVAEKLTAVWRQPVIIDNRAGAGGNIGAEAVASSPADGYVLLASPL